MKELDKTKSYDLSKLNEEQVEQLAEYVYENKHEKQKMISTNDTIKWLNTHKNNASFT